eukprot:199432_1
MDTQYWHYKIANIDDEHIYIVYGVNSYNVKLSSYQNFCYYTGSNSSPTALTNFDYAYSAVNFQINTNVSIDILSNFYVIQYARSHNMIQNIPSIPVVCKYNQTVNLFGRDYLNHVTKTRPDDNQLVPPIVLKFYIQPQ